MKNGDIDVNELKSAVENNRVDDFIDKNLSPEASQRLRRVLSDKQATARLLATPQAKELMKKLLDKDKNG